MIKAYSSQDRRRIPILSILMFGHCLSAGDRNKPQLQIYNVCKRQNLEFQFLEKAKSKNSNVYKSENSEF